MIGYTLQVSCEPHAAPKQQSAKQFLIINEEPPKSFSFPLTMVV